MCPCLSLFLVSFSCLNKQPPFPNSPFQTQLRTAQRKKNFKKTLDPNVSRLNRESTTISIRKSKKDENLSKRRQMGTHPSDPNGPMPSGAASSAVTAPSSAHQAKLDNLPQMVAGVMSNDINHQTEYTTAFRRLLSIEKNPPIQQVIDAKVVPRFIQFLQNDAAPSLQFEAAWALTNIASGTSDHTHVVISEGGVDIFVRLLASGNDDVREQAVWALGNIAGDSPPCRDQVLNSLAMQPLLGQLNQNSKLSMLRNATWTLSNFCRGKPQPKFELVRPCLPTLAQLIFSVDEEVLTDACWALSYLSDGQNEKIQKVVEAGVCRRLVELLLHPSAAVQTPALRTVGNIVTGDDLQTQIIINFNVLPCLLSLLGSPKKGIRKEACWTISNITAGNTEQIQSVIEHNLIPPLIQLLANAEFDIKKEAAWAISNATSGGSAEQIKFMVTQGCIRPLCELLTVSDTKIITVALEGLENILKVGLTEMQRKGSAMNEMATFIAEAEGLTKIEALQTHDNQDIYYKSIKILESYFAVDEVEDAGFAPEVAEGGNVFAFGQQQTSLAQQGGFNFGGV